MDAIFLSGESINNKAWIEEVEATLRGFFSTTKILYYDHWQSGEPQINLDKEFAKLPQFVAGLDNYFLFAKSIGSVLVLRGIYEKILNPKKCIFVGPAFLVGERSVPSFPKWIQGFSTPSIIITKTADPVAPASEIARLLKRYDVQNCQFIEIPGDNHKYEDLNQITALINQFILA